MSSVEISPKTVVEACFDSAGIAELRTVYDVANAVGLDDQPVRLAIRRMEAAGMLVQEGRGRKGRLVLSDQGRAREGADRRFLQHVAAQDAGERTWDEMWRLFTFSVPERFRSERDELRTVLTRLGAAPLAQGVYVSPYDLRAEIAEEVASSTVAAYLVTVEAARIDGPGLGGPREVAETLWPAAPIEAEYQGLARTLVLAEALTPEENTPARLAVALRLAAAFTVALERDPLIPPELRGPEWSPPAVRGDFRRIWSEFRRALPEVSLFRGFDV